MNNTLTNDIVSFEQLDPVFYPPTITMPEKTPKSNKKMINMTKRVEKPQQPQRTNNQSKNHRLRIDQL